MTVRPKIAFMTSLRTNVGDDFIREGICSFLDELFGNWVPFYVSKVDLSSLQEHREDETFALNDKFREADIIIQAGTPVYWRIGASTSYSVEWAEELWRSRIFQLGPEKLILNIAAGCCQPYPDFARTFLADPQCVEFARNVNHACAWTSVRDPLASQILYALGINHEALPCTAFHAARRVNIQGFWKGVVGINLMPVGGHWALNDSVEVADWNGIIEAFLTGVRRFCHPLFIAHDSSEMQFMERYRKTGEEIFYSSSWRDYLPVYAKCMAVVANRVHGAVCAAGFGTPAVIVGNDTRLLIGDLMGLPSVFMPESSGGELLSILDSILAERAVEQDRLLTLREESATLYREAIIRTLEEHRLEDRSRAGLPANGNLHGRTSPVRLASMRELSSRLFRNFMKVMNIFAQRWSLRHFTDWSKIWEYPWLWFNGLSGRSWQDVKVLDIGSELSPMPWFIAGLGASVVLVETESQWVSTWEPLRRSTGLDIEWCIVPDERLPFSDHSFDVVTSFSVIEHQRNRSLAIDEIARVLRPGGTFALSFDVCEPELGMSFPEWNGKALTTREFEELIFLHPAFDSGAKSIEWNMEDCGPFIEWHLNSAPHHNYTVGAAVLRRSVC